ncbi:MAG: cell division protein ZapE [Candidatus Puniceispirillaceae bacterium]
MAKDTHLTPKERYEALIATGKLTQDDGQRQIVAMLDELYHKVTARQTQSMWQKLRGRQRQPVKGLYLYGGVGRGKSMMMDLFYDCLPKGYGLRVHFHDFMVQAHDKMNEARKAGSKNPVKDTAVALGSGIDLLCFDEMEVRDIADAMIVQRLFDGLLSQGIIVVATSNRHPDELYKDGLHRDRFLPFIAQIKQSCSVQEIAKGQDWRSRLLGKDPRWYVPADESAMVNMKAQFAKVTNGEAPHSLSLKVAGRDLILKKTAHNIAFLSFHDLCAEPLAARDFVAIADRLTGLFMTDIPLLGNDLQNEARRFMWLIDALYDRGRFLVASSDCPMDSLYHGRQWAFEFDRTVSRLSEMSRLS